MQKVKPSVDAQTQCTHTHSLYLLPLWFNIKKKISVHTALEKAQNRHAWRLKMSTPWLPENIFCI